MKKKHIHIAITFLFALLLLAFTVQFVSASAESSQKRQSPAIVSSLSPVKSKSVVPLQQLDGTMVATLRAMSGAEIDFDPGNNNLVKPLPHLILYQDGDLTREISRTLIMEVTDITVPPSGVTVTLRVRTQHGDPDQGGGVGKEISAWRESRWITNTLGITQTNVITTFVLKFDDTVISGTMPISTPTDYFQYDIWLGDGNNPIYVFDEQYAFLMENQYETNLEPDGKNDYKARIHYCDMFPFGNTDSASWIDRSLVHEHISNSLAPMIQTVFDTEVNTWGFGPLHDAWDIDNVLEIVVGDGSTFFHMPTTIPMTANPIPSFSALNSVTQKQEVVR